jgi:hypothetical protein
VRQKSQKIPKPARGARTDPGSTLDETLKRMGEAFLEEEVPESLLEVLRRSMPERPGDEPPNTAGSTNADQAPCVKKQR